MNLREIRFLLAVIAVAVVAVASPTTLFAQPSIMQQQSEQFGRLPERTEQEWDAFNGYASAQQSSTHPSFSGAQACTLRRVVFGWHPYWMGTAYNDYDLTLLSDISYFSYEVDTATGGYRTIHSWLTTELIPKAQQAGVRVNLGVTLFGGHGAVLGNPARRKTLVDSLLSLVQRRGGNGVNIDFEGMGASQRANFTAFIAQLSSAFHTAIPGSQISIAMPAVDWNNVMDPAALSASADLLIIMGYDYHWGGAPNTGPVSPKNNGAFWNPYDVTRSINSYLSKGVPPEKLCLGIPYYGYDWAAADSTPSAKTTGTGKAVLFSNAVQNAATHGRRWDLHSSTPYYAYQLDSTWHQCWYDDPESLRKKYELTEMKGLAGIGIWALGYDGSRSELWDLLRQSFTTCAASPCSGQLSDMGGPTGNYYNREQWTQTIAPASAKQVSLSFTSFSVADDRLSIYDGRDTTAPLLGRFTGANNPGRITARSGAMTLAFQSNDTGVSWGWRAGWECSTAPSGVHDQPTTSPELLVQYQPNGAARLSYPTAGGCSIHVRLFDLAGRVVWEREWAQPEQAIVLERAAIGIPAGCYIASVWGCIGGSATPATRRLLLW